MTTSKDTVSEATASRDTASIDADITPPKLTPFQFNSAEPSSSCTTSTLVVATITATCTALLATIFFLVLQIMLCRHFNKISAAEAAAADSLSGQEDGNYDQDDQDKNEDRIYDQVLSVEYNVPSGGLFQGVPAHYDTPRSVESGDPTYMVGDHTYMKVGEGRVLITATTSTVGGHAYTNGMGVEVGGVAQEEESSSSSSESVYMDIDSAYKEFMIQKNEAYEVMKPHQQEQTTFDSTSLDTQSTGTLDATSQQE